MSLYKDPTSGRWYISLYDADRRRLRRSTGTTDKREAQLIHDELARQLRLARFGLASPTATEEAPPPVPLSEFAAKYDEWQRAKFRSKTASNGRYAFGSLQHFFGEKSSDLCLVDITVADVERWQVWALSRLSPATVILQFTTLKTAWTRAVRWGDVLENPFSDAERPRQNRDETVERVQFFEPDELEKLYRVTSKAPRWHAMIQFYLYSGMRRQELLFLEWSDIDMEARAITVHGAKTVRLSRTLKYDFRTKNGRRRVIPINDRFAALIGWLEGERHAVTGLQKCSLVFPVVRGVCLNRAYRPESITLRFWRSTRKAGLPPSLSLHSLRHTFASRLVQAGKSLYQVGELLGHSSPEMTKVYSHLSPKSLHTIVEDLDFGADFSGPFSQDLGRTAQKSKRKTNHK